MTTGVPKIATLLMRHLGCGPHNEALIGDLVEEFNERPSRVWYWKQVLTALVVGRWREVSAHRVLAVRAVALGWFAHIVNGSLVAAGLFPDAVKHMAMPMNWWRYSWTYPSALGYMALSAVMFFPIGRIVVRLHRPYGAGMAAAYLASLLLWNLSLFAVDGWRHPAFADPTFLRTLVSFFLGNTAIAVAVLCAGSLKTRGSVVEKYEIC